MIPAAQGLEQAMQRYRVNYTLLVVFLVGILVSSGAVYGLWRYQVGRKAGDLIVLADELEKEGKPLEVEQTLRNYLSIHPDDREVEVRYANLWADIGDPQNKLEIKDWTFKQYHAARSVLETTLRKYADEDELRRKMIDLSLYGGSNFNKDIEYHLNLLLNRKPNDTELMRMLANSKFQSGNVENAKEYAFELIGYDPTIDTFDATKAKAPAEGVVYLNLARVLREGREQELAERVMNQLVEANPELVSAYLLRSNYRSLIEDEEGAKADAKKALELDPKDADALAANADSQLRELQKQLQDRLKEDVKASMTEEEVAACRELVEAGIAAHPDDLRFYYTLAYLEITKRDLKKAMEQLNRGMDKVEKRNKVLLLDFMTNLQLSEQDVAGARKTAAEMAKVGIPQHFLDYIEARCLVAEERWFQAREKLDSVKTSFEQSPGTLTQIYFQLGLCRERLGQSDLAINAYKLAVDTDPANTAARDGITRIEQQRGTAEQSADDVELNKLFAQELQKPKEEQNWGEIDKKIDKFATDKGFKGAAKTLLKVELLMRRGDYSAARELIKQAYAEDPDNLNVRRAAYKLVALDPAPGQGPTKAIELLQGVASKYGDSSILRLDKADLLISINAAAGENQDLDKLKAELYALADGSDDWTPQQKIQFWSGLGGKFFQLKLRDDAENCLKKVTELAPGDLATRETLFKLAREENDDAGMKAAQEEILKIVGSKENSSWLFAEAQRLMSLVARGQGGEETLKQADDLIAKALIERPDWNELHLLRAEIELNRGNEAGALQNFDQAMKLGRATPQGLAMYAQLLVRRGRWVDARAAMEQLDTALLQRAMGQVYAETLINTGSVDEALKTADVVIESDPENPAKQLWYGQFVLRTTGGSKEFSVKPGEGDQILVESESMTPAEREALQVKLTKASKSLAKTVELSPNAADAWLTWVDFLAKTKQFDRAAEAIRQAQLALAEDELPIVLARCYEVTGRWFDAENRYRAALETNPDNVQAMRLLAAYYLGGGYPPELKESMLARANPLINRIMKAAADGKVDPMDENVLWARRVAAEKFAATGDYQNLLKAEKLLASNAAGGVFGVEDQLRMAQILAPRPEMVSRKKACDLLTEVRRNQPLSPQADLIRGKLLFDTGQWEEARKQMVELISRNPQAVEPRVAYIRMLLRRGGQNDLRTAKLQIDRLAEVAPTSPSTLELVVMLAIKTDKKNEARQALRRLLPADLNQVNAETMPLLGRVAELCTDLEDYEMAEQLYRFIAGKEPRFIPALATYLGTHREVESSFELLDKLQGKISPPVLIQSALTVLRARRDDIGNEFDGRVQTWLDRALREDPESITLQLQQAELHDLRGEYAQSAAIYRNLLKRNSVEGRERAIVLNNLAFLLALGAAPEDKPDEALTLVQEAVDILGPSSDILDTRAMVYLARNQYREAIDDLNNAVIDLPTASKWYHKALAHLKADQADEAVKAWKAAVALGLGPDSLNRVEKEQYEQTKEKIENPQLSSASL